MIIIVIIFLSFFGLKINKDLKRKQISEIYNSAIIDYSNGDLDAARDILTVVVRQKDSTYSPLALYFLIDNNFFVIRMLMISSLLVRKVTSQEKQSQLFSIKESSKVG